MLLLFRFLLSLALVLALACFDVCFGASFRLTRDLPINLHLAEEKEAEKHVPPRHGVVHQRDQVVKR